jgi:tRNA-specific 2-thiouridylase
VLATGHYISSRDGGDGRRTLHRAADADRDQSYFLFATTRAQLDKLRFPLGDLPKSAVRDLARRFGLAVADKPDSQDICFVPQGRYTDVVARLVPDALEPGDMVHIDGRLLGRHRGLMHYTVGQRRGLGLSPAGGEALYVIRLDAQRRQVVVGPRTALATRGVHLREVNWIGDGRFGDLPACGLDIAVRLRSSRAPVPALLFAGAGDTAHVELAVGEEGVAPGQACVFYDSTGSRARVLGGGFIAATEPARVPGAG